ncbi:MAG: nuclear transport factor 2 family protein [Deltaproteobacteria bacterium]|nr:nuclear transport factor 2 family protein [Deltaproteobacteria bacterium]
MAAKTLESIVNELADREAIRELPQRYCDGVWRGDVAGVVALFAEDGSFTVSGGGRDRSVHGRSELLKTYGSDLSSIKPRPYIHNHVIELKGNGRASGRCYVEVRNAADNMNLLGTGYYNDEYVKIGDEWKFQSRSINLIDLQGQGKR